MVEDKIAEVEQKATLEPKSVTKTTITTMTIKEDTKPALEIIEAEKTTLPSETQFSKVERVTTITTKEETEVKPDEKRTTITRIDEPIPNDETVTHKTTAGTADRRDAELLKDVTNKLESDKKYISKLSAQESGRFKLFNLGYILSI